MTEERKHRIDKWLARFSLAAGIVNTIASAAGSMLDAPAAWSTACATAGCVLLLATVLFQRHALRRHQPLLDEQNDKIRELTRQLESAQSRIVDQSREIEDQAAELVELAQFRQQFRRFRSAVAVVLEANTELRDYLAPAAIRACLLGDARDFVAIGSMKLLTALRNGLRVVSQQNGDDDITCALHIGHKHISSVHAAGTSSHRKYIEREYIRASHSLAGLVRQYPTTLSGDSLEDRPPKHNGETHSSAGWSGNIHTSIQSFVCQPIVTHDRRDEKAIGVLQVDSPARAAFPAGTSVLVEAVADEIGILFQIGGLSEQIQKQRDPLLDVLRKAES